VKDKKIYKHIFNIFCLFGFFGVGVFWGYKGWFSDWPGVVGLIAIVTILALVMDIVNKRFWPKPKSESTGPTKKESLTKLIISTVLQVTMGGAFTFGLIGIVYSLVSGNNDKLEYYIVCITVSIVLLLVLIFVKPLQDQQVKEGLEITKKDFKSYGKDERLEFITHKAVYVTFGVTLILLLICGAFITIYPPDNFNVITVGVLGIVGFSVLFYIVLVNLYNAEKIDVTKRESKCGKALIFTASLIPIISLGIIWIINGLPNVGIAYFIAFIIASAFALADLWYVCRYK